MENEQKNNEVKKSYNPLKDANFWVAFILGGGPALLILSSNGIFSKSMLTVLILLLVWEGWIIYKKGKKGSLIIGFILAIVVSAITFIPVSYLVEQQQESQFEDQLEEMHQEANSELPEIENNLNSTR